MKMGRSLTDPSSIFPFVCEPIVLLNRCTVVCSRTATRTDEVETGTSTRCVVRGRVVTIRTNLSPVTPFSLPDTTSSRGPGPEAEVRGTCH